MFETGINQKITESKSRKTNPAATPCDNLLAFIQKSPTSFTLLDFPISFETKTALTCQSATPSSPHFFQNGISTIVIIAAPKKPIAETTSKSKSKIGIFLNQFFLLFDHLCLQ